MGVGVIPGSVSPLFPSTRQTSAHPGLDPKVNQGWNQGEKPPRTLSYNKQDPVWGSSMNIKIKAI